MWLSKRPRLVSAPTTYPEVEEYAALLHGAQLFAYILGYRYHTRRGNKWYKRIAIAGMLVHGYGVYRHVRYGKL